MNTRAFARAALLWIQGFVAVTAFAGGTALVLGAVSPSLSSVLSPPAEYLAGSPFASYLVPGLLLALLLGGIHAVAFVLTLRRMPWSMIVAASAGFAALVWIFVQMVIIPFSILQAVYFAAGIAQAGFVMMWLGIFESTAVSAREREAARRA